ncbi:MAG: tetratricopeptide repeat protein [Oligoflexales bacterium]
MSKVKTTTGMINQPPFSIGFTMSVMKSYLRDQFILVFEPSDASRRHIGDFLERLWPQKVILASKTQDIPHLTHRKKVGLYIAEWLDPEGDSGVELCKHIRRQGDHSAFLLMGQEKTRQDVILASEVGIDDYLLKPFSFTDFSKRIRTLCQKLLHPSYLERQLRDADFKYLNQKYDTAFHIYQDIIQKNPESSRATCGMASVAIQKKQWDQAKLYLQQARVLNPEYIRTHQLLLEIYLHEKNHQKSFQTAQHLHNLSPQNPRYILSLAHIFLELEDFSQSEKNFQKILQTCPQQAEAWKGLGHISFAQENYDKAEKLYHKALKLDHDDASILNSMGTTFVRLEKYEEGIHYYQLALSLVPTEPKILYNIGYAYERFGKQNLARDYYQQTLKIQPDHIKSIQGLDRL